MNPRISIIVPVYNVEEYLCECVESLLGQTQDGIEIILINDGSSDASGEMCDNYAKLYANVKSIHQKNSGQSVARNVGFTHASGDYILFVDSDDWIAKEACEKLLEAAIRYGANVVHGDFLSTRNQNKNAKKDEYYNKVMAGRDYLSVSARTWSYDVVPVLNLVSADLIKQSKLRFAPGVYYEDQLYSYELYLLREVVFVRIPLNFYYYRMNPQSTTNVHSTRKAQDILTVMRLMKGKYNSIPSPQRYDAMPILVAYSNYMKVYCLMDGKSRNALNREAEVGMFNFICKNLTPNVFFNIRLLVFCISPLLLCVIVMIKSRLKKVVYA